MDDQIRSGSERVPPGQYVTDKWPVLTYGETPRIDTATWQLRVFGEVEQEISWSWQQFQQLPRLDLTADFHCVTRFSTLDNDWSGVATSTLIDLVRPQPQATFITVHCYGGYTTNLPLEDFLSSRALVADQHTGEPLAVDHGGPARLIVPHLYAWKSAKWISGLELMTEDRRGFWENAGYHSYGDPWTEQRFSSQETQHAYQVRRRADELGLTLDNQQTANDTESTS